MSNAVLNDKLIIVNWPIFENMVYINVYEKYMKYHNIIIFLKEIETQFK